MALTFLLSGCSTDNQQSKVKQGTDSPAQNIEVEFKKEQNPILEKAVETYLNDRIDTLTKEDPSDPSQSKFYKSFSSYIVLGRNTDGDMMDYYIWLQQRQFELQGNTVVEGMAASIPAAMKIKKTGDRYEISSYQEAEDGNSWARSIKKMYPDEIAEKIMNEYGKKIDVYFPDVDMELKSEAENYFKSSLS